VESGHLLQSEKEKSPRMESYQNYNSYRLWARDPKDKRVSFQKLGSDCSSNSCFKQRLTPLARAAITPSLKRETVLSET
jgi:hypothetical protein